MWDKAGRRGPDIRSILDSTRRVGHRQVSAGISQPSINHFIRDKPFNEGPGRFHYCGVIPTDPKALEVETWPWLPSPARGAVSI